MTTVRALVLGAALAAVSWGQVAPAGALRVRDWKPFALGTHHRRVSTRHPAAQRAFDEGLIWAFAFNHDEAMRSFQESARKDADLAMAWWGLALVNGPHINNPAMDEAHAKVAWEALGEAQRRAKGASPVEQALIAALAVRYAMPAPADRKPLDEAYAKAMGEVSERFPRDADVAALYAEALMDVRPWDQWTREGEPQPGTEAVLAALKRSLALDPNHPLALHLTIHALEASPHPERAKAAADRLRHLVPDASHLVHMPGHIYARIGDWKGAAEANVRAMAVDARYKARTPEIGFYGLYMAHNTHFLAYTAMMEGRKSVALAQSKAVVEGMPLPWVKEHAAFADAFQTVYGEALKRFGLWEEILAAPAPDPALPVSTAYWHALRGTAFAATGKVEEAVKEQVEFDLALPKVPAAFSWGANPAASVLAVAKAYLAGEIAFRQQKLDEAIAHLQEAVRLEDALKYDEPPECTVPARHALGAVLLAAKRPGEAEVVYRADLKAYPGNYWSLLGLHQALETQGKGAEARKVAARLRRAEARSDIHSASSCLCVGAEP